MFVPPRQRSLVRTRQAVAESVGTAKQSQTWERWDIWEVCAREYADRCPRGSPCKTKPIGGSRTSRSAQPSPGRSSRKNKAKLTGRINTITAAETGYEMAGGVKKQSQSRMPVVGARGDRAQSGVQNKAKRPGRMRLSRPEPCAKQGHRQALLDAATRLVAARTECAKQSQPGASGRLQCARKRM